MVLKRTGYYKEMPHAEGTDPSLKDYINKKIRNKKKICNYLRSGITLVACGGVVEDVLFPENGVVGPPDAMTDGKWLWPGDLAYYVERYNLQLDSGFVEHMEKQNWIVPSNIDIDYETLEVN